MDEDEQYIVQDQPLKVLNLFPKREINSLTLNYQNYSKLYENLTCTICRELLKSPVYLKCSHRFCKDCIERYIRTGPKRSCPNCRGELTTKRDLRCDYSLESLITFAFVDVKSFAASMQEFDKLQIQKCKSSDLKRMDSQWDSRQKTRQQTPEQANIITPVIKRVKTNDSEEPKRKRKMQAQKKIESKLSIQKQDKEVLSVKKPAKMIEEKQIPLQPQTTIKTQNAVKSETAVPIVNIQNFTREKAKKKKIHYIQIQSNSAPQQQEVQEIRREQFFNPLDVGQDKNSCSMSMIPQALPQVQSSKRIFSFQEIPVQSKVSFEQQKDLTLQEVNQRASLMNIQMKPQNLVDNEVKAVFNPQILNAVQLLKAQFGEDMLQKIVQMTPFPFYTELIIKKHPQSILTPEFIPGFFKFPLRSPLSVISTLLSDNLNINKESIKLYVSESSESFTLLQTSLKLYETNERYWKTWCDIELLELIEVIKSDCACNQKEVSRKFQRTIYYSIDFSKIVV